MADGSFEIYGSERFRLRSLAHVEIVDGEPKCKAGGVRTVPLAVRRNEMEGYLVDPASSICLSQRLSHACLSTCRSDGETANGSLNQSRFIGS
ncbi:hypothetical protein TNCT_355521 [Trichonephila clavata]|uniref:Uncharacterized protein n=1 Tax=Trichonephila clavata TaxID=2740835 RepID=A0A8X6HD41_TRICU|nr:hypothetical protein TNCT_355521 [Trichonephila clavata]